MNRERDEGVPVGNGELASPATFLLMSGFLVYEARKADADVRQLSRDVIDAVLSAAGASGFPKGDILETMMALGDHSERVWALADEATRAFSDAVAFLTVLQRAGVRRECDL